ncbi:MAG: LysR family transcriptional regulator [Lachnospiraceae bacterium]|nr:LysR family transcriptional regulator [Lachnospiraceae bacterium]
MSEAPSLTSYLVFNTVAKRGNLSAAAKELLISQPAVSRSLSKLEEGLSVKLFIRNSRGVRLTEEGAILYEHTRTAFDSLDQAQKCIERINALGIGTLRIGASSSLCGYLLMPKLKDFIRHSPNMKPQISVSSTTDIVAKVENGLLDVGLVSRLPSLHRLEYVEIMQITDTFVASPDYVSKQENMGIGSRSKEIFEKSVLFLPQEGSYTRHHIDAILDFNQVLPSYITEIESPESLREFALSGAGISAVAREFVLEDLKKGRLTELPLSLGGSKRSVGLCYAKTTLQSKALVSFLNVYR